VDWNDDGKKDLITGEYSGTVRIYLNIASDGDPVFAGFDYLQVNGRNFDCGSKSTPFIVDWNNDGKKDVLCGEDYGRVLLLLNTGTNAAPVFDQAVYLQDGNQDLAVPLRSSPAAGDWNRDGRKDLLVGEIYGTVFYFENIGSDEDPVFDGHVLLTTGEILVDVNMYSRLDLVDWDNDGVLDLLSGNFDYGSEPVAGVYFFQAVGPLSARPVNFIHEGAGGSIDLNANAGTANGSRNYLVLGTVTGTSPGTPLPGGQATVPVNWDPFTDLALGMANSPVFHDFMGKLNLLGRANARLNAPPLPGLAGISMHFAYCLNGPFDFASNAVEIEIVP
jgi:hypothetical protein